VPCFVGNVVRRSIRTAHRKALALERADSQAVVTEIERLNQLITVRYSIQRVVGIKERKDPWVRNPFCSWCKAKSRRELISPIRRVVLLPPPQIVNVFLDEKYTKVRDRRITWWTPWVDYNPDLEHEARVQALEDVKSATLGMGIPQQAQNNAELAVRDFLQALHLTATVKTGVS
jgi:uncharacterized protein DUF4230